MDLHPREALVALGIAALAVVGVVALGAGHSPGNSAQPGVSGTPATTAPTPTQEPDSGLSPGAYEFTFDEFRGVHVGDSEAALAALAQGRGLTLGGSCRWFDATVEIGFDLPYVAVAEIEYPQPVDLGGYKDGVVTYFVIFQYPQDAIEEAVAEAEYPVWDHSPVNESGIGLGSTEADVLAAYPDAEFVDNPSLALDDGTGDTSLLAARDGHGNAQFFDFYEGAVAKVVWGNEAAILEPYHATCD